MARPPTVETFDAPDETVLTYAARFQQLEDLRKNPGKALTQLRREAAEDHIHSEAMKLCLSIAAKGPSARLVFLEQFDRYRALMELDKDDQLHFNFADDQAA